MKYKTLGNTGVQVSGLCFGTMSFGGDADEATSARHVQALPRRGDQLFRLRQRLSARPRRRDPGQADGRLPQRPGHHQQGPWRHERRTSTPGQHPPQHHARGGGQPQAPGHRSASMSISSTRWTPTPRWRRPCARWMTWCSRARSSTPPSATTPPG